MQEASRRGAEIGQRTDATLGDVAAERETKRWRTWLPVPVANLICLAVHWYVSKTEPPAETRRRMMVISFHDKLARPARVRIVEAFIARAQTQKGVWFARKDELARFVLDSPMTIREAEAT